MHTFTLTSDYIELNKLLKYYSLVDSGAEAKQVITDGLVSVNDHTELRIRNKLITGDRVSYQGQEIVIVWG